ncbi:MAG: hypothetical protein IPJ74_25545 [Saprospiraceae bacterium]|nr:hypothetical protein [Saprospiraceae bacterium]
MRILIALFLLLLNITSCKTARLQKDIAGEHVEQLKNGVLLVRLRTLEDKIAALQKIGKTEQAEAVKQEQGIQNQRVIKGFSEYFDFCPVYFFYSIDAKQIRQHNFSNVIFNAQGESVSPNLLEGKPFYIGYYGDYLEPGVSTPLNIKAVVILDQHFGQLPSPFPKPGSSFFKTVSTSISYEEQSIQFMNDKLQGFLIRARYRREKQALKKARKGLSG